MPARTVARLAVVWPQLISSVVSVTTRKVSGGRPVASQANFAESTPGGRKPLGVEIDPTLSYESRDGFGVEAWYAVLFPLAGLDNPVAGLPAGPAQSVQVRMHFRF